MAIKDKNTLKTDLDVAFPDNTDGLITPEILRTYIIDLVDSHLNQTVHDLEEDGIVNFTRNIKEIFTKASAGTINPGEAVFIAGPNQVELADNTFFTGYAIGVALEAITDTVGGEVLVFGEYTGIDTSVIPVGTRLYLSATPGVLTTDFPSAGEKGQVIAVVLDQSVGGTVFMNPSDSLNTDSALAYVDPSGLTHISTLNVQDALEELDAAIVQVLPATGLETVTIEAVTTNPTKGGVVGVDKVRYAAYDDFVTCHYNYRHTTPGTAGNGHYLFSLPNGYSFNPAYYDFYTGANTPEVWWLGLGSVKWNQNNANWLEGYIMPYDATRFRIISVQREGPPAAQYVSNTYFQLSFADVRFSIEFSFWRA